MLVRGPRRAPVKPRAGIAFEATGWRRVDAPAPARAEAAASPGQRSAPASPTSSADGGVCAEHKGCFPHADTLSELFAFLVSQCVHILT